MLACALIKHFSSFVALLSFTGDGLCIVIIIIIIIINLVCNNHDRQYVTGFASYTHKNN